MSTRIVIADDHDTARRGIRSLISGRSDWLICGEAANGSEAAELARKFRPDIVLMDMSMPVMNGMEATRLIRRDVPEAQVIIVSQNDPEILSRQSAEVGAAAWVAKSDLAACLIPTIENTIANRSGGHIDQSRSVSAQSFQGGGQMGELIRNIDWEKTPLGPVASWSPALRMIVKFLLANRFPQLLWWGTEFCSIYNDAYIPILGAKHPWALGRPVSEVWREIWHVLKPLIETPFKGGPATWMEDIPLELNRKGFFEETHFTVAYSPVPDESVPGGIGGVLATVHEITEKVVSERRVHALRDLGARSGEPRSVEEACAIISETLSPHAKDIPFLLLYLLEENRKNVRLTCCIGADQSDRACPQVFGVSSGMSGPWPLSEVLASEDIQLVGELKDKFDRVPQGTWSDPPTQAAVLPIRSNLQHQLAGFMVVGLSSRLQFDKSYRDFLELLSTQVATTVANARAYEEERKRAEALAEIDRAKTLFFSNVSHEFRTPLTLMLGPLEDALSSPDLLANDQRQNIEVAHRNSLRLLKLVNTLLDFSRIEAGRIEACYEPIDLAVFTADLATVFRSAVERAGLKLVVNCGELGEQIYIDREMWEKIVFNLLSNALKFTFDGEIEVSIRRVGDLVELTVRDTGTGIPAHELPHLFERFYRVKGAHGRTFEGSGIGLALVQELVKLHGGSVRVESVLDKGTSFHVTIPAGTAHLPADRIQSTRTQVSTGLSVEAYLEEAKRWLSPNSSVSFESSPPLSLKSNASSLDERDVIVVADDNADMREYVAQLLSEHYTVHTACDGMEALQATRKLRPALVVADVMMPAMDGFGVLHEIRNDESLRSTPVVLLSARAGEESRVEGLHAGADDYLVKPFTARELIARVGTHVKMANLRRAVAERERQLRTLADQERRRLQVLLAQAPAAIGLMSGPEHRFKFVNRAYVRLTGRKRTEDFVGKTVREALPELEGQGIFELLDGVYQSGISYTETARKVILNRGPEGQSEDAYFDFVYQPVCDSDERVEGIFIHAIDVTYKVLAQRELESRGRQFREMIDALPAAIYTTDAEGRLTHFNPAAVEFSGRTPKLGSDQWCVSWKLYHPDGRPMPHDQCPMAIALKEGRVIKGAEAIAERPDGTRRWFMPFPTPLRNDQGKIVGGINMLLDITERKEAEQTTTLLAAIVSNSDDAIISMTLDGKITSWNRSAEQLFGYKAEEVIDQHITLIVPWERRAEEEDILRRLAGGDPVDHFETVRSRKDGSTLDVFLTISPLRDSTGRIVGASKIIRDITERKRIERALNESEERFRAIVETTPECVQLVGADGTLLHMNPPGLEIIGAQSSDEVVGKSVYDLIAPEERETFQDFNERICRGEKGSLQFDIIGLQGRRRHMESHSAPLRRPDGTVVHLTVASDITDRKRAEQALRESEQQLRVVTDASPIMLWMSSADKLCYYFNQGWLDFVGRTLEQEMGNGWAENVHPDDLDRCLHIYNTSFEARQPFAMEYRLRHHSGQYRWILDRAVPRYKEDGVFEGYVGGCLDIHDKKMAEEALRFSQSRLAVEADALVKLNEWSGRLWRSRTLEEALNEMLGAVIELLGADKGTVQLLDLNRSKLTIAVQRGFEKEFLDRFREITTEDESACGRALRAGKRIVIEDVEADEPYAPLRPIAQRAGYRAVISAPLFGFGGVPLGMVSVHFGTVHRPSEQDLHRLDLYIRQAADFIVRYRIEDSLRRSEEQFRIFRSLSRPKYAPAQKN